MSRHSVMTTIWAWDGTSQLVFWNSFSASTASCVLTLCGNDGRRPAKQGFSPPAHWSRQVQSSSSLFSFLFALHGKRERKVKVDVKFSKPVLVEAPGLLQPFAIKLMGLSSK